MSKLYVVQIYTETVVVADSEEDAERLAERNSWEIVRNDGADAHVLYKVQAEHDLPDDWHTECHPWGGDGEKAVRDYL